MKKVFFVSLGCVRNLVDTEVMIGILLKKNIHLTNSIKDADFIVVNTCGFIKDARDEGFFVLKDIFLNKKKKAKVIVAGCMVERYKDAMLERFPEIFYFLGSGNIDSIKDAVTSKKHGYLITKKSFLEGIDAPRFISTNRYAYLKISEGCLKKCSYCSIPKIKGPLKSKPISQIVKEFKRLLDIGIYEIILIGQDIGDYGKDLKIKNPLLKLLKELLKIKKDFWIRLLYLYPDNIEKEFLKIMKGDDRVCKYIDMPIQHVNDHILKKMKRTTSKKMIIEKISLVRKMIPDIFLRTSLIAGFPDETEKQFLEMLDFIKKYKFEHLGVFAFSKETDCLEDNISKEEKERRVLELYKAQKDIVIEKNKSFIGKTLKVLISGKSKNPNYPMFGRHYGQAPDIDSIVLIKGEVKKKICHVKIEDYLEYDLVGNI